MHDIDEKVKWKMFRNFMYNELGITKEDIRAWLLEAAEQEAKKLAAKSFDDFDMEVVLIRAAKAEMAPHVRTALKQEIQMAIHKAISEKYEVVLSPK